MTPQQVENRQWGIKFIVTLIMIIGTFSTIGASHKIQQYRIDQLERSHTNHVSEDYKPVKAAIQEIKVDVEVMKTDVGHIREGIQRLEDKP